MAAPFINGIGLVTHHCVQFSPVFQKDGPLLQKKGGSGGLGVCWEEEQFALLLG